MSCWRFWVAELQSEESDDSCLVIFMRAWEGCYMES